MKIFIDIKKLLKKEGIEVIEDSINMAYILDIEKNVLWVNNTYQEIKARYAMAHALAHLYSDNKEKRIATVASEFRLPKPDTQLDETNETALKILMPEPLIRSLIFKEGITDIVQLSKILKVSELALYTRLKHLNLIK